MEKRITTFLGILIACALLSLQSIIVFKMCHLQKKIESLQMERLSEVASESSLVAVLQNSNPESILLLGDSISDNNGAWNHISSQEQREKEGFRLILADSEEGSIYEDNPDSMGWSWYFRQYMLENTSITTFHNNAIGGKSAKWFNAHKELIIPQYYDIIVVMLGTNDRWDCTTVEEFQKEYGELLAYAANHCQYLQVLAPIPAFTEQRTDGPNLNIQQIAESIVLICKANGYSFVNLYESLPTYAEKHGMALEEFYFGDVHPSPSGHQHLWNAIAEELELNHPPDNPQETFNILDAISLGANREDITETTLLSAQMHGQSIFPQGISLYWFFQTPFINGAPETGVIVTYKYSNTMGKQIFRARDEDYVRIRYVNEGSWGPWQVADFE